MAIKRSAGTVKTMVYAVLEKHKLLDYQPFTDDEWKSIRETLKECQKMRDDFCVKQNKKKKTWERRLLFILLYYMC